MQAQEIDKLVEQILFYARSNSTEKDYFIKQYMVEDLVHQSMIHYKDLILLEKISIEIEEMSSIIFMDEKWFSFILNQIIGNAIKYKKENDAKITISCIENENQIVLEIEDNGTGIKTEELSRVFEKGFTGTNRQKKNATGMGLYLVKKLCDNLQLGVSIDSVYQEHTKVSIVFPKGNMHQL